VLRSIGFTARKSLSKSKMFPEEHSKKLRKMIDEASEAVTYSAFADAAYAAYLECGVEDEPGGKRPGMLPR
jgi:hypothetical protein